MAVAQVGQAAYLDGPYGAFSTDIHQASGYVFIAGGVGITPIMGTLRTFAPRQDMRPLLLVYGNREWDDIIFREELEELKGKLNLTIVHVLSAPNGDWNGESGYVTAELLDRYIPKDRGSREYFVCGPDKMMDALEAELSKLGVTLDHIHSERFNFV